MQFNIERVIAQFIRVQCNICGTVSVQCNIERNIEQCNFSTEQYWEEGYWRQVIVPCNIESVMVQCNVGETVSVQCNIGSNIVQCNSVQYSVHTLLVM